MPEINCPFCSVDSARIFPQLADYWTQEEQ